MCIMLYIMPSRSPPIFPSEAKLLSDFGERLRLARLRRKMSSETVAKRAGVSRMTLCKAERGAPTVTLGTYLRVLAVLGLDNDFLQLAKDDVVGRRLQDLELPTPRRAPRKSRSTP
jgi:transcriptional regulator with XRE-family HTH domain